MGFCFCLFMVFDKDVISLIKITHEPFQFHFHCLCVVLVSALTKQEQKTGNIQI